MRSFFNNIKKLIAKDNTASPPPGTVQFGSFRRLQPLSREFGFDRGGPIDRYYIEKHLNYYKKDIQGRVLEIKSNDYTRKFGGDRVTTSDVLDIDPKNTRATIIADLTKAENMPSNTYDCMVFTQVLQFIYDYQAAIRTIHRILKPGGVLLMTVPGITQIAYQQLGKTWFWSFSEASVKKLLGDIFGDGSVKVEKNGNVMVASGFLYGMGAGELTKEELEHNDPDYQVIITARAVKAEGNSYGNA